MKGDITDPVKLREIIVKNTEEHGAIALDLSSAIAARDRMDDEIILLKRELATYAERIRDAQARLAQAEGNSRCGMTYYHAPHKWDTEQRVVLRYDCPGLGR